MAASAGNLAPCPVATRYDRPGVWRAAGGVAYGRPHVMAGELVRCADHAVYRAKAEGRGRFAIWDDELADRPDR